MADQPRCPECSRVLELADTVDAFPPIPFNAWPERWHVVDEDRVLSSCPDCGADLDAADIAEAAGLPRDYVKARRPDPEPLPACAVCHHGAECHGPHGCEVDSFSVGFCFCASAARADQDTLARDALATCETCGDAGEITVGISQDYFGNWDTETFACPDCTVQPLECHAAAHATTAP